MGQKVNPIAFRLGIEDNTWDSRWYAEGTDYVSQLHEDFQIRNYVNKTLNQAGISKVIIERVGKKIVITLHTSKPGVVIGKKGTDIEKIKKELASLTKKEIHLNIAEIKKPELDAKLVADSIALQLERRASFRRVMKRAMQQAMRFGAEGIRINCSGRLAGAEIARMEWYREGRVPLHTLRANIDYGVAEANTTYGVIGVKVWIFKGLFKPQETIEHKQI